MRYNGGKHGCGAVVSIVQSLLGPKGRYVEPFCGSCKVLQEIRSPFRLGFDLDHHIITLLKAVQKGWQPPRWSNECMWEKWKYRAEAGWDDPHIGVYAYGCSFGGMFFQSYIRPEKNHGFDPAAETRSSLLKQKPRLEGVTLNVCDYRQLGLLNGQRDTVVYCDPPYDGTQQCGSANRANPFDSGEFWKAARGWSNQATVLVSEYDCPLKHAMVVWQKTKQAAQGNNQPTKKKTKTEKLFALNATTSALIGLGVEF
jgi:site-specific DNA-adenine methylase